MTQPFIPTFKWHMKVWGIILLLCTVAFCTFSFISRRLPHPYKHRTPVAEVTPWTHAEVNK